MYKYKCYLCEREETVSDEIEVFNQPIPLYVKRYMETKNEIRPLCNDCYHKVKHQKEKSVYLYVKFLKLKNEIFKKLRDLKNDKE